MAVPYAGCGGGKMEVLTAVPDAGCGRERRGSQCSPRRWLWGGGADRRLFSWQFTDAICEVWGGGCPYFSPIRWLWGGQRWVFTWQS